MTTRNHIYDNNKDNNNRGRVHIFLFIVQLIELAFDTVIVEESRGRLNYEKLDDRHRIKNRKALLM